MDSLGRGRGDKESLRSFGKKFKKRLKVLVSDCCYSSIENLENDVGGSNLTRE